ncbi:glycoside hydrolase family 3 N-terminal domain-containing protein [Candidatus Neomarinimicrobiota bacterium]
MLNKFFLLVVAAVIVFSAGCSSIPQSGETPKGWKIKPVAVDDLTLEQQIGQMIMVRIEGFYYSADNNYRQKLDRWVSDEQIGGLITFRGSVDGTFTNLQEFQRKSLIPLLVAADLERGVGQQVQGATLFPTNMAVAATYDEQYAYEQGRITAQEARALGIHITFAPVMDVNNNPKNPIINFRAFSDDPEMVARLGAAFIRGAQKHGLVACAKHYPGHGNTSTDSHTSLPVIPGDRATLDQMELLPFKTAAEAGVKMMMVGHIAVPGLDESRAPATQSAKITEELLRKEFKFDGVIVTDGMEMTAALNGSWSGEAAIRAVEAGNDMILLPLEVDQTIRAIERAVSSGRISKERIRKSAERILKMKAELGLYEERQSLKRDSIKNSVGLLANLDIANRVVERSITLIKDERQLIPFEIGRQTSVSHILLSMDDDLKERTRPMWSRFKRVVGEDQVETSFVNEELDTEEIRQLVQQAKRSDYTLVSALIRIHMDKGESSIDPSHQALLDALGASGINFAVITFGSPYLPDLKPIPAYLATYGYSAPNMHSAIDAVLGRIPITGKLPISLSDQYPRGHGIQRTYGKRLFGSATHDYDFSAAIRALEQGVIDHVTPGAQVFVSQRGVAVLDTAVGHYTYGTAARPVDKESIYDLASVTKVLVGATIAMKLVEGNYLVLDDYLSNYFPEFTGPLKDSVTVRHLLTHSSGLPAYKQFWELGIAPEEVVPHIIDTDLQFQPGSKYEYSDLGLILFGALAERVTGKSIEELAKEWVFEPLRMENTAYNPPTEWLERIVPTENYTSGYRSGLAHGSVHDRNTHFLGGVSVHAGVFTTSRQLARIGQLYLNGGLIFGERLFNAATLDAFVTQQKQPEGSGRALLWQMANSTGHSGSQFSPASYGHTGYTGTAIWIDPERELVAVLLTNRVHPSRETEGIKGVRQGFFDGVINTVDEAQTVSLAR